MIEIETMTGDAFIKAEAISFIGDVSEEEISQNGRFSLSYILFLIIDGQKVHLWFRTEDEAGCAKDNLEIITKGLDMATESTKDIKIKCKN